MAFLSNLNFKHRDILLLIILLTPLYFVNMIYFYTYPDEYYYISTTILLLENGTVTQYLESPLLAHGYLVPTIISLEYISMYPIGQSLLIALFYLIGGYYFIYYMNGILGILAVILTYNFVFEISHDRFSSFTGALLLGLCPPTVFYSRTLTSDLPSMTFLLFSFLFYLRASRHKRITFYFISSLSLGFAVLIRYPNILFVFPIILNQIRTKKLSEISNYFYYIPLIPFLCVLALYNYHFFGNPFITGYHQYYTISSRHPNFSFVNIVMCLPRYFVILNLFPPLGLIASFLYIRRKWRKDVYFISLFMILTFIIFYSSYASLPFEIEHLFIEAMRFMLVILPYLCINSVLWFRDQVKTKLLSYSIPIAIFIILGVSNIIMLSQYNAFKTRLIYYRDVFYTNTEPDSLIIGNDAWDKLFLPYFSQTHGERYYLRYDVLSQEEVVLKLLPFIETWMDDNSVYFIDDPYVEYAYKNLHDFVLQLLNERYHLQSIIATDQPYTIELFKLN